MAQLVASLDLILQQTKVYPRSIHEGKGIWEGVKSGRGEGRVGGSKAGDGGMEEEGKGRRGDGGNGEAMKGAKGTNEGECGSMSNLGLAAYLRTWSGSGSAD